MFQHHRPLGPMQRKNRLRGRVVGLLLAVSVLALQGLMLPQPAVADHAPSAPRSVTYAVTFQSSGQSVWGSGADAAPDDHSISLFQEAWDGSDSTEQIWEAPVGGMKFGGGMAGSTKGDLGLGIGFNNFRGGSVAVAYPLDITLTVPDPNSFRAGQTIRIGSKKNVRPGASLTAQASAGNIALTGNIGLGAAVSGQACFFDCAEGSVFSFDEHVDGKIFDLVDLVTACDFAIDVGGSTGTGSGAGNIVTHAIQPGRACEITTLKALQYGLPFTGKFSVPNIEFSTVLLPDGSLVARGADNRFINLDLNLARYFQDRTGVSVTGVSVPPLVSGVDIGLRAWDSKLKFALSQRQQLRFTPTVQVTLQFPQAVSYSVQDSAGREVDAGISDRVTYDVGNSLAIVVPEIGDPYHWQVTPTFSIKNGPNFLNSVETVFDSTLTNDVLRGSLRTPSVEVIPSQLIVPEVCVPLLGCTPEVRSPSVSSPSLELGFGPVVSKPVNVYSATDSSLFDGNRAPWSLGGFTTVTGQPLTIDPEYRPVARVTGPSEPAASADGAIAEGEAVNFSAGASFDPDQDPLTYLWALGDGTQASGHNITHAFADNGGYTATLTARDGHGVDGVATQSFTVINVPPTVAAGADKVVAEGAPAGLGLDLFGHNLVAGGDAESGIAGWTVTSHAAVQPYGPAGSGSLASAGLLGDNLLANPGAEAGTAGWSTSGPFTSAAYGGAYGVNLIVNPDAETGDLSGWNLAYGTLAAVPYRQPGTPGVIPSTADTGPVDRGNYLFYSPSGDLSASQTIELSALASDIDAGTVDFTLSAYLGQTNRGFISIVPVFYDATGNALNDQGLLYTNVPWKLMAVADTGSAQAHQQVAATVPAGARRVELRLFSFFINLCGGYFGDCVPYTTDSFLDNMSLVLTNHNGSTVPPADLRHFFTGASGDSASARATQTIDVSSAAGLIDDGQVQFRLDGWLGGSGAEADSALVRAHFNGAAGPLGEAVIGPVTAAERSNQTTMLQRTQSGLVPAGTRSITVEVELTTVDGQHSARADNLSFTLLPPPGINLANIPGGGFPSYSSPGPPARGNAFFRGGDVATSSLTQRIDVSAGSDLIDQGLATYQLSGYLGGLGAQGDSAALTVRFNGSDGQALGSGQVGPVTAADRQAEVGGATGLLQRVASGAVPPGTRSVDVTVQMSRQDGTRSDGYADNLSLVLLAPSGATVTDPGALDTHTAVIHWGDGTTSVGAVDQLAGLATVRATHVYADNVCNPAVGNTCQNGHYLVTVTATDNDGGVGTGHFLVQVINQPPVVTGVGQVFVTGQESTGLLATFTDPGRRDAHSATIAWGDGTVTPGVVDPEAGTVTGTHRYDLPGPYPRTVQATVTVTDNDGAASSVLTQVTVVDERFATVDMGSDTQQVTEGGTVAFTGGFGPVQNSLGQTVADLDQLTFAYTWDFGDGTATSPQPARPGESLTASHTYADNGTYTATFTVEAFRDGRRITAGSRSHTVTVANANPVLPLPGNRISTEGDTVHLDNFAITDAGVRDTITAAVDWGDGTLVPLQVQQGAGTAAFTAAHAYPQSGVYTATVTVTDKDGGQATTAFTVTVQNAPPVVTTGPDQTGTEGAPFAAAATFTDAGVLDRHTATIDWGDGTTTPGVVDAKARTIAGAHTYANDGTYTVTVSVTDNGGGDGGGDSGSGSYTVKVVNGAPVVRAGTHSTAAEGAAVLAAATFTDPGPLDTHAATIDWGDGTVTPGTVNPGSGEVTGLHTYAAGGTYTVTVTVDDGQDTGSAAFTMTVENVAPTPDAGPDQSADEGTPFTISGSFTDPGFDCTACAPTVTQTHSATVDWGDGSAVAPAQVNWTPGAPGTLTAGTVAASHTYAQDGQYAVTLCVQDTGGARACDTLNVSVGNLAPAVDAGTDQTTGEGEAVSLPATVDDPGLLDTHTATIAWGDGTRTDGQVDPATRTVIGTHTYDDNVCIPAAGHTCDSGRFVVTVTVADGNGGQGSDSLAVQVTNRRPTVNAGAPQTAFEGNLAGLAPATFTDPGLLDGHTATIDWGDGTITDGQVSESIGTVFGTHAYADEGEYPVKVCVTDQDGDSACDETSVTVRNVPPQVSGAPDTIVDQDSEFTGNGAFTDPGGDTWTATVDYGDGSAVQTLSLDGKGFTLHHTYTWGGFYSVTVTVADEDAGVGSAVTTVTVNYPVPVVQAATPVTASAGAEGFTLTVTGTDFVPDSTIWWNQEPLPTTFVSTTAVTAAVPATALQAPGTAEVTVVNPAPGGGRSNPTGFFITQTGAGVSTVRSGTSTDPSGTAAAELQDPATGSAAFRVTGQGAGSVLVAQYEENPGNATPFRSTGGYFDAYITRSSQFQSVTVVDCTNGGGTEAYWYNGSSWIRASDQTYDSATGCITILVNSTTSPSLADLHGTPFATANLPPTIAAVDSPTAGVPVASEFTFSTAFADPAGPLDGPYAITIDWGDGSTDAATTPTTGDVTGTHTYDLPGTYTIAITVTDAAGGQASTRFAVTTVNVPPAVVAPQNQAVAEGSELTVLLGQFSDVGGGNSPWTVAVRWGDNSPATTLDLTAPGSIPSQGHTYSDNGTYSVSVTVTDSYGGATTTDFTVAVANVDPTVDAGPDSAVDEGSLFTGDGSFTDPGADTWTATVDYGDGTGKQPLALNADKTFSLRHVYAHSGTYTVTVTVSDDDGGAGTGARLITVNNVAPTVDAGPDQSVDEGSTISLAPASFNDKGTLDTHTATVDWGDGSPAVTGKVSESPFGPPGNVAGANGTVSGSHVYADNGTYTVTVTVTDAGVAAASDTFSVTVNNVTPTVEAGPDQTVNEGSTISLVPATFSDKATMDTHIATVDWGDGSPVATGTLSESPFGPPGDVAGASGTVSGSHVFADNGTYTVTVTVSDDDGGSATDTFTVRVSNVAPTLAAATNATLYSGQHHTVRSDFTDPGVPDTHTATIDWGDGSPADAGTVVQGQGSGTVQGDHTYFVPGVYTVTVCVTDKDGGTDCTSHQVTVERLLVALDVKPGSQKNPINLKSNVPVAILTTAAGENGLPAPFDATSVLPETVRFGPMDLVLSGGGSPLLHGGHVDGADMVLQFDAAASRITETTTQVCVWGRTSGNVYFQGCATVQIVPAGQEPEATGPAAGDAQSDPTDAKGDGKGK